MKKVFTFSFLALACAALLAVPQFASAQERGDAEDLDNPLNPTQARSALLLGPRIGISRNYHSGGFRTFTADETCPLYEAGSGWGYFAGITAEFIPAKATWSIIPAIVYESRPGSFKQELEPVTVLLENQTEPVQQIVTTSSDIVYKLVTAEVLYKQEFASIGKGFRVSVAGGPTASYVLDGKVTQVQDLVSPTNARFINTDNLPTANSGRRLIYADNKDIPGRNTIRFSLKAGVQAEIGLFNNALIMYPGAFFDYGLSNVTNTENWGLNSILFQLDFRRAF
jgi:hypothetical protein